LLLGVVTVWAFADTGSLDTLAAGSTFTLADSLTLWSISSGETLCATCVGVESWWARASAVTSQTVEASSTIAVSTDGTLWSIVVLGALLAVVSWGLGVDITDTLSSGLLEASTTEASVGWNTVVALGVSMVVDGTLGAVVTGVSLNAVTGSVGETAESSVVTFLDNIAVGCTVWGDDGSISNVLVGNSGSWTTTFHDVSVQGD